MRFIQYMQSHKRTLLLMLAILVLGGIYCCFKLPVSLFPHVDFPRVEVTLDAGEQPTDLMAIQVTWPMEEAFRGIPGVLDVRSTTSRGSAEISIMFDWGLDMISAMLQIESAIHLVPNLPPDLKIGVRRMDPTVFPVLAYSLTSNVHSLEELRDLALYEIKPILSTIDGVARIGVIGDAPEEYGVILNIPKMISSGLSIQDIAKALSAENVLTAVGRLEEYYKLYLITSDTRFKDISEIRNTVLRSGEDGTILIEDVAEVTKTVAPHWTRVTANGTDAVILQVYQQPKQNTIQINHEVTKKLESLPFHLTNGIKYEKWYDQSEIILASALGVRDSIIIGVFLSTVVLYLFLRNIKITFLSVISVPSVISITVLFMFFMNISFNIMTLGGLAAAVGLIIDDTIVMIEHIVRRLRESPDDHHGKVMMAANQFTKPLIGSSVSTIIIFLPLAFFNGITGSFFKYLSLTMGISLIISFLIAWLVIPILSDYFLNEKDARQKEAGRLSQTIQETYEKIMSAFFKLRGLILVVILAVLLAAFACYQNIGSGFMPRMDEGGFILDYLSPPGTSLTETDRLLRQVEKILQSNPAVETYSRRTGLQLGGGITEANQGDFFVRLKPYPRDPIEKIMEDVRSKIEESIPILQVELSQLMEDLIGDLTAVPQPIEIKLFSDHQNLLKETATKVADAIGKIPGVVDVKNGIVFTGDALDIKVDRVKSSLEGMDPESITQTLKSFLAGIVTTQIQQGPKMVGVRVWIPEHDRANEEDIKRLLLRAPDGHLFPLQRIAEIKRMAGQTQIVRDNLKQMIAVTGRVSNRDMGTTLEDVKQVLRDRNLISKDVYFTLGGLYAEQQAAFKVLLVVFTAAVMLVFLLLLFLYESFAVVFASLITTLLSGAAVFIGLWITSTELDISSLMGLTMIVGISTKMSIFYFSEYFSIEGNIDIPQSYILAGKNRMRPIAMTIFATILALLPLTIFPGMQQPLAIAIISGLIVELPLVLTVLPVVHGIFNRPLA